MILVGMFKNKIEVLPCMTIRRQLKSHSVSFRWILFEIRFINL